MVWKFCGKAQFPHSFGRMARNYAETAFLQNFHTMKLGEITVFYAVVILMKSRIYSGNDRYIVKYVYSRFAKKATRDYLGPNDCIGYKQ